MSKIRCKTEGPTYASVKKSFYQLFLAEADLRKAENILSRARVREHSAIRRAEYAVAARDFKASEEAFRDLFARERASGRATRSMLVVFEQAQEADDQARRELDVHFATQLSSVEVTSAESIQEFLMDTDEAGFARDNDAPPHEPYIHPAIVSILNLDK